jgi:hypothetical protein
MSTSTTPAKQRRSPTTIGAGDRAIATFEPRAPAGSRTRYPYARMSERHVQCSTCGAIGPESDSHNVPTLAAADERYVDGYYCSAHAGAALDAARAHLAALDFEDDTRDDMKPLVSLHALVRARGLRSETLAPPAPGVGMERVRNEALALL